MIRRKRYGSVIMNKRLFLMKLMLTILCGLLLTNTTVVSPFFIQKYSGNLVIVNSQRMDPLTVQDSAECLILLLSEDLATFQTLGTIRNFLKENVVVTINSFEDIERSIASSTVKDIVVIGHGSKKGLHTGNVLTSWRQIGNILDHYTEFRYYLVSCFSSMLKSFTRSQVYTFDSEVDAFVAGVDTVTEIYKQNHHKGYNSVERYKLNCFYLQRKSQPVQLLTRTISAKVRVDDDFILWYGTGHQITWQEYIKSQVEISVLAFKNDFDLEILIPLEGIDCFPSNYDEGYGSHYTTSNLGVILYDQAMTPGWTNSPDWDEKGKNNDYDILIVITEYWNDGNQQANDVGNDADAIIISRTTPFWNFHESIVHELGHVFNAKHESGGVVPSSYYDNFQYPFSRSIMDYTDIGLYDVFNDGYPDWDDFNFQRITNYIQGGAFDNNDPDGDGLTNYYENLMNYLTYKANTDGTGPNDANEDYDGDGWTNIDEINLYGTNPALWDSDFDGIPDKWEFEHSLLDPLNGNDGGVDREPDGLTNFEEYLNLYEYGEATELDNSDTDGDDMPDGWECTYQATNPITPDATNDPDNDFLSNYEEYCYSTNPSSYTSLAYVRSASYIYHRTSDNKVYSYMKFKVDLALADGYYIKVEYRWKPEGGSYGSWITKRQSSAYYSVGYKTISTYLMQATGDGYIQVRWSLFKGSWSSSDLLSSRTETLFVSTS